MVREVASAGAHVGNVRFPHHTARWLTAAETWRMATDGGARAMGLEGQLGALEPGRQADIVLLRMDSTALRPMSDILGSLVYVETGASVDTVLVGGRVVMRSGRVLGVDERALRTQAQAAAAGRELSTGTSEPARCRPTSAGTPG